MGESTDLATAALASLLAELEEVDHETTPALAEAIAIARKVVDGNADALQVVTIRTGVGVSAETFAEFVKLRAALSDVALTALEVERKIYDAERTSAGGPERTRPAPSETPADVVGDTTRQESRRESRP